MKRLGRLQQKNQNNKEEKCLTNKNDRIRYQNGHTPWDTGKPDSHLIRTIFERFIQPRNALEIGCGSGNSAIWLAQNGFSVTSLDIFQKTLLKKEVMVLWMGLWMIYDQAQEKRCFNYFGK